MTRKLRAAPEVLSLLGHTAATVYTSSAEVRNGLVNSAAIAVAKAGTDRLGRTRVLGIDGGLETPLGMARA
jgi:hypothetical protein